MQTEDPVAGSQIRPLLEEKLIDLTIVSEQYHVFEDTTVTVCCLNLINGAKVIGYNYGSIDPTQQNWELGKATARAMAVEKVWELEGYLLRQRLFSSK